MPILLDFLALAFCLPVEGKRDVYKGRIDLVNQRLFQFTQLYQVKSIINCVGP